MADETVKSRLGRGLAALIGDVGEEKASIDRMRSQRRVPIEYLRPNPRNPRKQFTEAELDELSASIRERGIIQPILVRTIRGTSDAIPFLGIQVSDAAGNLTGPEHWLMGLDGYTTGYPNNDLVTTVAADGKQVDTILEMTNGLGAEAIIDFVGERGAIEDGVAMLAEAGSYYVIGYGENINVPTIDIISREINFIGNLVGSYNDLAELMTLTAQGKVTLHTSAYPLEVVNDAMADLDNGRLQGRGILVPAGQ